MTRREFLVLSAAVGLRVPTWGGQVPFEGSDVFDRIMRLSDSGNMRFNPIGELTGWVGRQFVGSPYASATLERNVEKEYCFVSMTRFDCVTFFEASLNLARCIKKQKQTSDDLVRAVTETRYRDGKLSGYASRLHYTSDWMDDNARRGIVRVVTGDLIGAVPYDKKVDYMSSHPDAYPQLKARPEWVAKIAAIETEINKRGHLYVPKDRVVDSESLLATGDIVGITTTISGIDCSHTGLIVRDGDRALFMHASSSKGQVIVGGPISDYLASSAKATGLMVVRPVEPA